MKNITKILIGALIALTISSCSEFLNEPQPTDQLASTAIYSSREGVEAYLSGIYRRFRASIYKYPWRRDLFDLFCKKCEGE